MSWGSFACSRLALSVLNVIYMVNIALLAPSSSATTTNNNNKPLTDRPSLRSAAAVCEPSAQAFCQSVDVLSDGAQSRALKRFVALLLHVVDVVIVRIPSPWH